MWKSKTLGSQGAPMKDATEINTDNYDDADATGENLGKRNVYRKLSNSELPQRAA